MPDFTLEDAKLRLDRLIAKARADLYKPIAIAEILHRERVAGDIRLSDRTDYQRRSYDWMLTVVRAIHNKTTSLNSRYWDQTFDPAVMPPEALVVLGEANRENSAIVERYIYWHVKNKFAGLKAIRDELSQAAPETFELERFIARFENDARFRRSVDKAYEIIVYALFNAVTAEMGARVTLSIDEAQSEVLADFEDFAQLVLGIDSARPAVSQPARLFRVGTANAADAGLDMWANFGPAVQVKHITLSPQQSSDICEAVQADRVVIVCKSADANAIQAVLTQIGLGEKLRGVITENELLRWYRLACSEKYRTTLGVRLLASIDREMHLEFPLTDLERIDLFFASRAYGDAALDGLWQVEAGGEESAEQP